MKPALRWRQRWSCFDVASALFLGYLLTVPLQHAVALRNLFLYSSFLVVLVSLYRREVQPPRAGKAVYFLFAYALVAVFAVLANQVDMERSLHGVRTELLVQIYILWFALLYMRNRPSPRPLLLALGGGFVLLTLLGVYLLLRAWILTPQIFSAGFELRQVVDNYGLNSQFYLPVLFGGLAALPFSRGTLLLLGAVGAIGYGLAVWYNTTSGVVFVSLHLIFLALRYLHLRFRVRISRLVLVAMIGAVAVVLSLKDEGYKKILAQEKLLASGKYYQLLSLRVGMWAIGIECAKDAPWYGYGYDEKKVALVCSDEKYLRPARQAGNPMAGYFRKQDYGGVSLHNQYLANWFVSGWPGSLLWLAFFIGACHGAWKKRSDEVQLLVVLPCLLIFLAGCFFNGLWEGPATAKAIMVILAFALAPRKDPAGSAA